MQIKFGHILVATLIAMPLLQPLCSADTGYEACFDTVWNTINYNHWDARFGGMDWDDIRHRYRTEAISSQNDSVFFDVLNRMIFELNLSHAGVVPAGHWPLVEPTVFATGDIGADVRMIGDKVIVVESRKGSNAGIKGLQPGDRLLMIDGRDVSAMIEDRISRLEPPYNRRSSATSEVQSYLRGPDASVVTIQFVDCHGDRRTTSLTRSLSGESFSLEGVLPTVTSFESKILAHRIGYVRFNWFYPSVLGELQEFIRRNQSLNGLLIDLRGNSGGVFQVAVEMSQFFVNKQIEICRLRTRNSIEEVILRPSDFIYDGPLTILVDVMSKSASECFAAFMRYSDRALIVGQRTPGSIGPADMKILQNGATLVYPIAQLEMPDGSILEGSGVTPDIQACHTRDALCSGRDIQLEAAIDSLLTIVNAASSKGDKVK